MPIFTKEIQYLGHILSTKGIKPLPSKSQAIQNMHPPKTPNQVCAFFWTCKILQEIHKKTLQNKKPLTLLTCHQAKFEWTWPHYNAS